MLVEHAELEPALQGGDAGGRGADAFGQEAEECGPQPTS